MGIRASISFLSLNILIIFTQGIVNLSSRVDCPGGDSNSKDFNPNPGPQKP